MKTSTIAALGGLGLAAYLLSRKTSLGLPGAASPGTSGPAPLGPDQSTRFDPARASMQPDFTFVTDGCEAVAQSTDGAIELFSKGFGDRWRSWDESGYISNAEDYYRTLWRPATRIGLDTLTKSDFDRAGYFLAAAWRKGVGGGCPPAEYDKVYGHLNQILEDEASGLEIGAKIGIALASLFTFGAAASTSDASFGFGRGASEDRGAKVDVQGIGSGGADIGLDNAFAPPKTDPAGEVHGSERVRVTKELTLATYPNLFYPLYKRYDAGYASIAVSDHLQVHGTDGNTYIRIGYAYPWNSAQMGCALSYKERVYIAARMLRTLDTIACGIYPRSVESDTVINLGYFNGEGELNVTKPFRWDVQSTRFGLLRGSIFPGAAISNSDKVVPLPGEIARAGAFLVPDRTSPDPRLSELASTIAGATDASALPVNTLGSRFTRLV